jgi:Flp pilus assembly protein TadD
VTSEPVTKSTPSCGKPKRDSTNAEAPRLDYDSTMPDARALYREGFQHFAENRIDEAIDCYQRAVDAEPDLAIAWNGLSMTLKRKGDLDGAIEAGLKIVELEPDDPLSHTNLSILYQAKDMIQEAEDEKALAMQLQLKAESDTSAG